MLFTHKISGALSDSLLDQFPEVLLFLLQLTWRRRGKGSHIWFLSLALSENWNRPGPPPGVWVWTWTGSEWNLPNNSKSETCASERKPLSFSLMSARFTHRCLSLCSPLIYRLWQQFVLWPRAWNLCCCATQLHFQETDLDPGPIPSISQPSTLEAPPLCTKWLQPDLLSHMPYQSCVMLY